MNKVVLTGRWSKGIDFKALDSGKSLAKSSIAVDEGYVDKKQTHFFEVEMWGKTAEAVANFSGKGKKVLLEGRLKLESWEKDGVKRYAVKIVAEQVEFLEPKQNGSGGSASPNDYDTPPPYGDDDLPMPY